MNECHQRTHSEPRQDFNLIYSRWNRPTAWKSHGLLWDLVQGNTFHIRVLSSKERLFKHEIQQLCWRSIWSLSPASSRWSPGTHMNAAMNSMERGQNITTSSNLIVLLSEAKVSSGDRIEHWSRIRWNNWVAFWSFQRAFNWTLLAYVIVHGSHSRTNASQSCPVVG